MLLFGGSSLELGGFLEPDVHTFIRSTRIEHSSDLSSTKTDFEVNSTVLF